VAIREQPQATGSRHSVEEGNIFAFRLRIFGPVSSLRVFSRCFASSNNTQFGLNNCEASDFAIRTGGFSRDVLQGFL